MKKDVLIFISGTQVEFDETENNANEAIEIISPATYFFKDGLHYVFYEDVNEDRQLITKNKIIFKENEYVQVVKKGGTNSEMLFRDGEEHKSTYDTPFGMIEMGLKTHNTEFLIEEEYINITSSYELFLEGEEFAQCDIIIKIQEKSQGI